MYANFIAESCTGTTGDLTLTGAKFNHIALSEAFADTDSVSYVVEDANGVDKCGGVGTYNSAGTITRNDSWTWNGTSYNDSPGGNLTLSAGAHTVRVTAIATQLDGLIDHSNLADEHIDWSATNAKNVHADNYTDTVYNHPANHPPSIITQDSSNRFVSDAEKTTWNHSHPYLGSGTVHDDLSPDADEHIDWTLTNAKNIHADNYTDTVYSHPANHPPSIITQDSSNRFVTDAEKSTWSGKSDAHSHPYLADSISHNDLSPTANEHIDWTEDQGATNIDAGNYTNTVYSHPANHPATIITQTSSYRFVTDAEKSTWNGKQANLGFTPEDSANKGANNGYAELNSSGLVPTSQLPSFVDDVVEAANFAALPGTGETGKIYVTIDDNKTFRWTGSIYAEISASLALGETSTTAYRGDRGKTAYDHAISSHDYSASGHTHATLTPGTGLSGSSYNGSTARTWILNFDELTDMTADIAGTTEFILQNAGTESRKAASEIKLSAFNDDLVYNNYSHPTYTARTGSFDTGPLTGATVISDINLDMVSDSTGHLTSGYSAVSTRTLTLADLGYTGSATANDYSLPSSVVHDTESGALHATDALRLSGHTVSLYKGDGTFESVTIPDNNTVYSHPSYNGDDFSVDTGALSGATVVSDIDINVTTDGTGHVTDANGSVSTRTLTAANIGAVPATSSASSADPDTVFATSIQRFDPHANLPTNAHHAVWTGGNQGNVTGQLAVHFTTGELSVRAYNTSWTSWATVRDTSNFVSGVDFAPAHSHPYNNYTHPSYNGDDFNVDTGALSGATVVSDIDINVTTDSTGHVTDANGTVSTRTLTAGNIGAATSGHGHGNMLTDAREDRSGGSLDTIDTNAESGFYYWGGTQPATGSPGWNYGGMLALHDTGQTIQLAFGSSAAGRMALRRKDSGTWYGWTEFATKDWVSSNFDDYSHPAYSSTNINTSGATIVDIVTTNSTGHVTALGTRTLTLANLGYTGSATANDYSFPYTVSSSAGNNTVVQRSSSGYIYCNYINGSSSASTTGASSGMGNFIGNNGTDTFMRSYNASAVRSLINVANGANNYSHPTHPGDDFSLDTGHLSGATVIDDIDINVSTDTLGHVTDCNGTVATRTLTLADLGYTGHTAATNNTGTVTSVGTGTGLDGSFTTSGTITLDLSELTDMTAAVSGTVDEVILLDNGAERRKRFSEIGLSVFSNDLGLSNYTHPTHPGDDFSIDTGHLSGAYVIDDIDINVTTDGEGHVTDCNGTVATRQLTLANLGYTGSATANDYSHPSSAIAAGTFGSTANGTKIDQITVDEDGHITAVTTGTTGDVTQVTGTGTVSGLTLTGTVNTSGSLTLGGTLSLTSGNVTNALGYTPYQESTALSATTGTFTSSVSADYFHANLNSGGSWDTNNNTGLLVTASSSGNAYNILRVNTDNGFKLQTLGGTGGTQRWYTNNTNYITFSGTTITASLSGNATTATTATTANSVAWSNVTGQPTIPTNNTQLTNGAGYITSSGNTWRSISSSVSSTSTSVSASSSAVKTAYDLAATKGTSNLALGSSSSTAYRGDRGTTAYNHSQAAHAPSNANYYVHPTGSGNGHVPSASTSSSAASYYNATFISSGTIYHCQTSTQDAPLAPPASICISFKVI